MPPSKVRKITDMFEHKSNAAENAAKPSTSGQTSSSETEQRSEQLKVHYKNDIEGLVHPVKRMSNQQKLEFLIHLWTPDKQYKFPRLTRGVDNKVRHHSFQLKWLIDFNWLIYSHTKQGDFCKFCAIFAPDSVGGSFLGMFVKQPFTGATNYANGTKLLREHAATHYHQSAVIDASFFMQSYHTGDVANTATTVQQQRLAETKKYLKTVVSAIHFCGL